MNKQLAEKLLRKALMGFLLLSAVYLAMRTDYAPALLWRQAATEARTGGQIAGVSMAEAAEALCPRAVLLFQPEGTRSGSVYQAKVTMGVFRRFSALLGEAVGSAAVPSALSEAEFREGLTACCAFFSMEYPCPLSLLSDWLGAGGGGAGNYDADLICLVLEGEAVSLRFRAGGKFYGSVTAVQPDTLIARLEEYQGTEVSFAWENPLLEGVEPYLPLMKTLPPIYAALERNGADCADTALLAEAVGMNSRLVASYYDADGTLVMNEDGQSLRLERDGTMTYRSGEDRERFPAEDRSGAVAYVCRMLRRCAASCGGDGEIVFAGLESGPEEGEYTVRVNYSLNGIPYRGAWGEAGWATVRDGRVVRASLNLRQLSLSSRRETVLPTLQTAAIAAAQGGGAPELTYLSSGERVNCVWVYG